MIPFSVEHWMLIMPILGILYALLQMTKSTRTLISGVPVPTISLIITVYVIIYIGTRPLWAYADTVMYVHSFNSFQRGFFDAVTNNTSEWFWQTIAELCVDTTDASGYLFVIATLYIGAMGLASWLIMRRHYGLAIAFLFTSFSFFAYGTNGLRQGVATSFALLGLAFITLRGNRNLIQSLVGLSIIYLGSSIHSSILLSLLAACICLFRRNVKLYTYIWIICAILSIFLPSSILSLVGGLIDDGRISHYQNIDVAQSGMFNHAGWRWDFILYSVFPILFGWYISVKRKFNDYKYDFLLCMYVLTNAAWVLINSIAFSNRFAYISWSMYPLVIAYPLATYPIFKHQGLVIGLILVGWIAFTLII